MPIAILLILLLFPSFVHAQSLGDLYTAAINQGTAYRTGYAQYLQAKNQFLQYNTAPTRLTAIAKTASVLDQRNRWQIAYLSYLREVLATATNIANYSQTTAFLNLETEINRLQPLTFSFDSFAALNSASLDWEKRLEFSDKLVAAGQLQITSARLAGLQNQLAALIPATMSSSQKSTLDLVSTKLATSISLRQKVDSLLSSYRTGYWSKSTHQKSLEDSRSLLLEATRLLSQISTAFP